MGRSDGTKCNNVSNFDRMVPFIMVDRYDATNYLSKNLPYEKMAKYISEKRAEGEKISVMNLILASYIRTVHEKKYLNRFVVNKRIYDRKGIYVSFVVLRDNGETIVKMRFDGSETLSEINKKICDEIISGRNEEVETKVDNLIKVIFSFPLIPSFAVGCLKLMDKYGIMPKSVIEASPFHTSVFFTNMASIKMNAVYHHLYKFGTTSVFLALGSKQKSLRLEADGGVTQKEDMPLNISADERICSGHQFAKALYLFEKYLTNPALLEICAERNV